MRDIVVGIKITAWHSMPRQIFLHMCVILSFISFKITFFYIREKQRIAS